MPPHAPGPAPAAGAGDWIDLLAQLHADEGRSAEELRRRDRAIGRELAPWRERPVAQLVGWVRSLRRSEPGAPASAAAALRLCALLLAAGGLAFGALAAAGAFAAGPGNRINAVAVLGLLVGVQWIFLALALLNALPSGARRFVPWLGSEPEGGGLLQPAYAVLRLLPAERREVVARALGRGRALDRLSAPVRRWLLLGASQGAGVCFNLGALAATLALVVFQDLSFGWSTTLDVEPASLHRVTTAVATPWAPLWPAAVPTLELIDATRTFRIEPQDELPRPAVFYGGWWPFLCMALAVYGLLPRLLFFGFCRWRLRGALRRAIAQAPGARRVLDRLNQPLVETRGGGDAPETAPPAAEPVPTAEALPPRALVLSWAEAIPAEAAAEALGCAPSDFLEVGGQRSLEEDEGAARRAAAAAGDAPVVLAVRGYEAPLLEVQDFLGALRRELGDGPAILVVPVGGGDEGRERWRRFLGAVGDPWLSLARAGAAP